MILKPDPDNLTKLEFLAQLLKDPERKSIGRMGYEMVYLFFVHRDYPGHYFSRYLFKKDKTNILDYYPWKFLYSIKSFFNEREVWEVLENKLYFDLFFRQFNISLPEILMYNFRNMFFIGKSYREVKNIQDFKVLLNECFDRDQGRDSVIIKRTYWSYGGDKVYKVFRDQIENDPDMINDLYLEMIRSGFLVQETVRQHSEINKLNPSCLNTIRIDSYLNPENEPEIISAYIRMSIKNLPVDNISAGGLQVGIDIGSGKLKKEGFSNLKDAGVKIFTEHPVTKTVFENFQIPFFREAKDMVIKASGLMPGLRLVGWDVAIEESGPVLIEGNSDYDNTGNDLSEGGYRTNPVFRKVLDEYKVLKAAKKASGK